MAAASLLEAEIVTADGAVRIANACTNSDLFWGLKGGGGGSLGVVTRLTLRTHDLPDFVGAVNMTIKAASDVAFRRLIGRVVSFYSDSLSNPHWGEQIAFRPGNVLAIAMVFQGLDQQQAETIWRPSSTGWPVLRRISASCQRHGSWLCRLGASGTLVSSRKSPWCFRTTARALPRPTCSGRPIGTKQDRSCMAISRHGFRVPPAAGSAESLGDALFAASRHWGVSLHVNKGLAGAPADAIAAARDTAINPAVLDAFALVISGAEGHQLIPAFRSRARSSAARQRGRRRALAEMRSRLPTVGSYVAESNFFEPAWWDLFGARTTRGCSL